MKLLLSLILFTLSTLSFSSYAAVGTVYKAEDRSGHIVISGSLGKAGSGIAATDVYKLSCLKSYNGLYQDYAVAAVVDLAPVKSPLVSVYIAKSGYATTTPVVDPIDGIQNAYPVPMQLISADTYLYGKLGTYYVYVNKSAPPAGTATTANLGPELYKVVFNCQYSGSIATQTVDQ